MKVSVIVPVYNVEDYIAKCLNSLVNQTLEDIEIIVVDDSSPDNSKAIIDDYIKKYPSKIKYFYKENGGQGSARNLGLKHAQGEYIAYVDSDDYIELDMLEKMYNKAIQDNSDIVICGNRVVSINDEILEINKVSKYNDIDIDILFGNMAVWNKVYRHNILNGLEFREKLWYEDIDFTIKVLLSTKKISIVDEPLYDYLLRPGSTMNNSNYKRNLELIDAFNEMITYFKSKGSYENNYAKLEFLALYHMYIMGITRIININVKMKEKKVIINRYIEYMNNNFSTFKSNQYIKYMDRNKKIVYTLINMKLYHIIRVIFKVKNL